MLFAAPYFIHSNWITFVGCYAGSQLLDAVDGNAARYFNQCSRFGIALDMVCDRACIAMIFLTLATMYQNPILSLCFLLCFVLDFGANWLQFMSSAMAKSESHKGKNDKENWLVGLYYNNKKIFMAACVGAEIAAISWYIVAATWA